MQYFHSCVLNKKPIEVTMATFDNKGHAYGDV